MSKVLFIDFERCTGCLSCLMACCMEYLEAVSPAKARIAPVRLRKLGLNVPVVCRQCIKPLCANVCPMGAISRNNKTGAMVVDSDTCIGCRMCMTACPLGGISVDTEAGHSVKCNLCEGDPQCVKACAYKAIEYITAEEAALRSKKRAIQKLATMLEKIAY